MLVELAKGILVKFRDKVALREYATWGTSGASVRFRYEHFSKHTFSDKESRPLRSVGLFILIGKALKQG